MSDRVCIQQRQGLVVCPRIGISSSRIFQAPRALLFIQPSRRFNRRGLTVCRPKIRLHKAEISTCFAEYTNSRDSSQDVRNDGVDLDLVHGDDAASNSEGPQLREIRDGEDTSVNGISVDSSVSRLNSHTNGHVLEESYSLGEHYFNKIIEGDVVTQSDFRGNGKTQKQNLSDEVGEKLSSALHSQVSLTDDEYYVPVCGHSVIGVVVSGNYAKLDVDIGAAKLGQIHVQEVLPLDKFQIDKTSWTLADDSGGGDVADLPASGHSHVLYDEEVFTYEAPEPPLLVDIGTVLEMEVVGITTSGKALLSARKAAQRIEWNRIMQIKEAGEPFEVTITGFNKAGLLARVEGLRAFLPHAELINQPDIIKGENYEPYVGRTLWVSIAFAKEVEGNLVLSEKNAWVKRRLQVGSLHEGFVAQLYPYGALVKVNGTGTIWGMIHISNISNARIDEVSNVFEIGEQIKMMVVPCPIPDKFSFSTALLESEPGLMLRDKQRVFREAEERARTVWNEHPEWKQPANESAGNSSTGTTSKPIANSRWLEFVKEDEPLHSSEAITST